MRDIHSDLQILKVTRQNTINLIKAHHLDQLNEIPSGFSNNLIWNFGHVIVTMQLLVYGLSGIKMYTDKELVKSYRKGTKPTRKVHQNEVDELIHLALSTVSDLEKDYKEELFQEFKIYTTSYNITLTNVVEAIKFNNVHEAMHFGTCLAIKKFI
ncbi:DinB family protein [Portibacter marinus]|uniref:DinB family protein n=1 Tax=Portibacter marinus TaxID=2898660 RepID=UPI001F46D685|nr:DinB family protein [Portibacter marinus]